MKKISALLISICLTALIFSGCTASQTAVKAISGQLPISPSPFSDHTCGGEAAPIIGQVTTTASADDSIEVAGKGFAADLSANTLKAFIKTESGELEAEYTVIDDYLMTVTVPAGTEKGVYAVYVENASGKSNIKLVNAPKIWYLSSSSLAKDSELCIYGENLVLKGEAQVFLYDGEEYFEPVLTYSDPHKIVIKVPDTLKDNQKYSLCVYNGSAGAAGLAEFEEQLTYKADVEALFSGKTVSVVDYGADPKDIKNDDTAAVKAAAAALEDGDILYFPKGYYLINEDISISVAAKIMGDDAERSVILSGNAVESYVFKITALPSQIEGLGFEKKKLGGKITTGFISIRGDSLGTDSTNIRITDCKFIQSVETDYPSHCHPISIENATGIVIENNYSDSTAFLTARSIKNTVIKNNTVISGLFAGYYYGQDTIIITDTERLDISNNSIKGRDSDTDMRLDLNSCTVGRAIVIQGYGINTYIALNTIQKGGLPHCNAGELILLENLSAVYDGSVAEGENGTVVIDESKKAQVKTDSVITVVAGDGKYQYRTVKATKGSSLTLDSPFDGSFSEDSRAFITRCFLNTAIYKNSFNGYTNWDTDPGSGTSLQAYGSTHNLYMEENEIKNLPEGICITPYFYNPLTNNCKAVVAWSVFDNNVMENNGTGIRYVSPCGTGTGDAPVTVSFGILIRRCAFNSTPDYKKDGWIYTGGFAISIGNLPRMDGGSSRHDIWDSHWINGVLIENCSFKNSAQADIVFCTGQKNTLLRNNGSSLKTISYEGASEGIEIK